jgi:hypothetical protein
MLVYCHHASYLLPCLYIVTRLICHHAYLLPPCLLIATMLITLHQALSFFLTNCLLVLKAGYCTMTGKASTKGLISKVWGQEKPGISHTRTRRPPTRFGTEEEGEREVEVPRGRGRGGTATGTGRVRSRTSPIAEPAARRRRVSSMPSASEVIIAY